MCRNSFSRSSRNSRVQWSDDILQLAAGDPTSLISRFRRARQGRRSIDRDYMRSCPQTRRFCGSDTTVRTILRWQHPRRHGHEDMVTLVVDPLRGIVARHSRQTQRYVDYLFFSIGIRCDPVLLRLRQVEDGVVCGGYDAVWSGFDGLSMISASGSAP